MKMIAHPEGALPALGVLNMRFHGDRDKPAAPELIEGARTLLIDRRSYSGEGGRADHDLATLARIVFRTEAGAATAVGICRALQAQRRDYWSAREFPDLARELMKSHPRIVLDEIVATAKSERRRDLAGIFFGGTWSDVDDRDGSAAWTLDQKTMIDWVAEDPQLRAERLAGLVPYAMKAEDTGEFAWTPLAVALIDAAPDPRPVLTAFEDRFFTGVSSGPFSTRYVRRLPMVAALKSHADRRVRAWAREAFDRLEEGIEHWDRRDREGESRFE